MTQVWRPEFDFQNSHRESQEIVFSLFLPVYLHSCWQAHLSYCCSCSIPSLILEPASSGFPGTMKAANPPGSLQASAPNWDYWSIQPHKLNNTVILVFSSVRGSLWDCQKMFTESNFNTYSVHQLCSSREPWLTQYGNRKGENGREVLGIHFNHVILSSNITE